ncbi:MAG: prephenate dehydrogenase [Candidatus Aadella gelida]|nr:prephenate dehydrogenase [Candidatus Aadella gelida]
MDTKFKKIVIVGMGLIGGSLGKALMKNGSAEDVTGICRRQVSLDKAFDENALLHGGVDNYEEAVPGADIVVIATPVHVIKDVLDRLAKVIKDKNVIVTDAGSTKNEIVKHAEKYKDKFSFVGSHPLAGSEKSGVGNSSAELFKGSVCILTPADDSKGKETELISAMWKEAGVDTIDIMTPEKHDKNLAFSSHLPHIVSYALAGTVEKEFPHTMAAAGFRDTTRIANSEEGLWSDIFMSNRENVLETIRKYKEVLENIESSIRSQDEDTLKKTLKNCRGVLDDLFPET